MKQSNLHVFFHLQEHLDKDATVILLLILLFKLGEALPKNILSQFSENNYLKKCVTGEYCVLCISLKFLFY